MRWERVAGQVSDDVRHFATIATGSALGCAAGPVNARAVEIAPAPARTGAGHDARTLGRERTKRRSRTAHGGLGVGGLSVWGLRGITRANGRDGFNAPTSHTKKIKF